MQWTINDLRAYALRRLHSEERAREEMQAAAIATRTAPPAKSRNGYNTKVVLAWMREMGIPEPTPEFRFCQERMFRADFAWPDKKVCLECQGGLFSKIPGGHNRGAAIRNEHIKRNLLACLGWRILYCETETLCTASMAETIRQALGV